MQHKASIIESKTHYLRVSYASLSKLAIFSVRPTLAFRRRHTENSSQGELCSCVLGLCKRTKLSDQYCIEQFGRTMYKHPDGIVCVNSCRFCTFDHLILTYRCTTWTLAFTRTVRAVVYDLAQTLLLYFQGTTRSIAYRRKNIAHACHKQFTC